MDIESLFSILDFEKNEGAFSARIKLKPGHAIFTGHFPGNPILPGVCMLHIVKEVIKLLADKEVHLKEGNNIKFLNIIDPRVHTEVEINGSFSIDGDNYFVNTSISATDTVFFKFKGMFSV